MVKLFKRWKSKREKAKAQKQKHLASAADTKRVEQIKNLCETGKWSAENLRNKAVDKDALEYERAIYETSKKTALKLTSELKDIACLDTAFCAIIDLCIEGKEISEAKKLFTKVKGSAIRDVVTNTHPELGEKER